MLVASFVLESAIYTVDSLDGLVVDHEVRRADHVRWVDDLACLVVSWARGHFGVPSRQLIRLRAVIRSGRIVRCLIASARRLPVHCEI